MFQSQLFKRSFINTSLMIIQKKMNEKNQNKQKLSNTNATNGDKDSIIKPVSEKKKKDGGVVAVKKSNQNQSMNGGSGNSNLENLAK